MPKLEKGLGMKQTVTFWLWLNDLSYREKNFKEILRKSNNNLSVGIGPRNGDNMRQQFNDGFIPSENKLFVNVRNNSTIQSLEFNDFPIQKWLHFAIVLDNRNVDVFMNGELKKSMILESPPALDKDAELIFNSNGGFDGKVSNAKVFNYAVCHAEIVQLLKDGPITLGIWDRIKGIFSSAGDRLSNINAECPASEKKTETDYTADSTLISHVKIDTQNSTIKWVGSKITESHEGTVNIYQGVLMRPDECCYFTTTKNM